MSGTFDNQGKENPIIFMLEKIITYSYNKEFFSLLMGYITLTTLWMLNQPCIPSL